MRAGRRVPEGFLPVFSVDTMKEAKDLITAACCTNLAGEHYARELLEEQTLINLAKFSDRLAQTWEWMQQARKERRKREAAARRG